MKKNNITHQENKTKKTIIYILIYIIVLRMFSTLNIKKNVQSF